MKAVHRIPRTMATVLAGIVSAVLLMGSSPASAEEPDAFIKRETKEVTELLAEEASEQRAEQFSERAQQLIDFEMLASNALGEHWKERSDEERQQFLTLLQQLLEANYKRKLEGKTFGEDFEIEYLDVKQREDKAFVETLVKWGPSDKERKPVAYKMIEQSGDWVIYDVVIDDISLESTYRESYTEIIDKEGWDALIEKMKTKIEKLRQQAREGRQGE